MKRVALFLAAWVCVVSSLPAQENAAVAAAQHKKQMFDKIDALGEDKANLYEVTYTLSARNYLDHNPQLFDQMRRVGDGLYDCTALCNKMSAGQMSAKASVILDVRKDKFTVRGTGWDLSVSVPFFDRCEPGAPRKL